MDRSIEFGSIVQRSLERLSPRLKEVLRELIDYHYDPVVKFIRFEIFPEEFTRGFPVMAFFFDAEWNEYFETVGARQRKPCGLNGDLLLIDCVYTEQFEDEFAREVADPLIRNV